MSTLVRGPGPRTRVVSGGSCLFLIGILINLPALQVRSIAQSPPSRAVSPTAGGPAMPVRDRATIDRPRSIELYRTLCLDCHEEDGRGDSSRELMRRIPDFTRPEWHVARGDDLLLRTIREGKGLMPPMNDRLPPRDVVLLVSLVRNFRGGGQVVPDDPEEEGVASKPLEAAEPTRPSTRPLGGISRPMSDSVVSRSDASRDLFHRFCVSCHGADGRGGAMRAQLPRIPDFASPDWHPKRSDAELATSILEGKGTAMPPFGGKLAEPQVREVITYVRSLVPAADRPISKPSRDFRRRFEQLRDELERLDRQYRALSSH